MNMKDLTLVIMAAGMGSRFGGLKQITPVDDHGNFIIDYSIFDAKKAGFNKVVFIIKEENLEVFKDTVGKRVEGIMHVEYAIQSLNQVPGDYIINAERVKPLGTVHAVLAAEPYVNEAFAVINADDFYGYDTYKKIADFFQENREENEFISVLYPFEITKSEFGSVKRGVCYSENGYLIDLIESSIEKVNGEYVASPLVGGESFIIPKEQLVSMNVFGFNQSYFKYLENYMINFLRDLKENDITSEALLPECLKENIKNKEVKVKVERSNGVWLGMTNKDDLDIVKNEIKKLVDNGEYPEKLWS